ncbi:glycosyltransferase family 4 protein [Aquisalimonas sp.]|uniref:glycosyltransferase family 4 protein n=1 Tax=Aquisalimonas sp. TaxID=1872621 RepID=UPI0025BCF005|nr:glycosyltransferase family 4 protein [Aquisalimonas sp.]
MRIMTLSYEYPPIGGGGGVVAAALARELVRAGHEVDVVTSRLPEQPALTVDHGVRVHRHRCRRRHPHFTTAWELTSTLLPAYRTAAALIKRDPPQLIHAHFALPTGLVALMLSRRFGIPYVLTLHGSDVPGYNPDRFRLPHWLAYPLWRRVMAGATEIVSPSEYLAGLARKHMPAPIQIVPNGYCPGLAPQSPKRKLVLVVARLFPRKGVQHFLDAIRDLDSDWDFVVAGDGPYMQELVSRARSVRPRVRFLGFVDRETINTLYSQARILVFPSIQENFPMVLLEGMDAGCAVITANADGCAEVVGDTGLVVPVADPEALRVALERLLNDEVLCRQLAGRSMARATMFRWPRIAKLYMQVFADALHWRPELHDQVE